MQLVLLPAGLIWGMPVSELHMLRILLYCNASQGGSIMLYRASSSLLKQP